MTATTAAPALRTPHRRPPRQTFVDGRWIDAASGATMTTLDPATGEVLATVPRGGAADIDTAVAAARRAFDGPWSKARPAERQLLLLRVADAFDRHWDELSLSDTLDMGKPLARSRADKGRVTGMLRYYAGLATSLDGRTIDNSLPGEFFSFTRKDRSASSARSSRGTPPPPRSTGCEPGDDPIREALSQLAYERLLERHDRAMRVRVLKAEDILEIYEVRIALERAAARAAAERRTELDLGGLGHILDEMRGLDEGATDRRPKLAHAFHFAIWRAGHNATLVETLESVHLRVMGLSSTTLHYPQRWKVFTDECVELLNAIWERDVPRAGDVAEQQMTDARDFRVRLYSSDPGRLPDRHPPGR